MQLCWLVTKLAHEHLGERWLHRVQEKDEAELGRVRVIEYIFRKFLSGVLNIKVGNQQLKCLREVVGELFGARSSFRTVVLQVKLLQAFHNLYDTRPPFLVHLKILHGVGADILVKLSN